MAEGKRGRKEKTLLKHLRRKGVDPASQSCPLADFSATLHPILDICSDRRITCWDFSFFDLEQGLSVVLERFPGGERLFRQIFG